MTGCFLTVDLPMVKTWITNPNSESAIDSQNRSQITGNKALAHQGSSELAIQLYMCAHVSFTEEGISLQACTFLLVKVLDLVYL